MDDDDHIVVAEKQYGKFCNIIQAVLPTMLRHGQTNAALHVVAASLAGTTIEYFDFYIYGTAAVLVFPRLFFPASDPATATVASLATFGVAFVARPLGSILFGHFGDRFGRKATLVAALLTMGVSTIVIGLLPTYERIGLAAPVVLGVCRFGQGLGLGGEWGGAMLVAIENAPPERRAWYGIFPQLGAPIGLLLSGGVFLALAGLTTPERFLAYAWRLPFIGSAVLVVLGFYVRTRIAEAPIFRNARERGETVRFPVRLLFRRHAGAVAHGMLVGLAGFVAFYIVTIFALSWATTRLAFTREGFLVIQLLGSVAFAAGILVSAAGPERRRRRMFIGANVALTLFAAVWPALFTSGKFEAAVATCIGMAIVGVVFGPLGTELTSFFPVAVRYSGTSLAFSGSGILGAALAPYAATFLAGRFGLGAVGWYMAAAGVISTCAIAARNRPGRV
jgi:MFS family permease